MTLRYTPYVFCTVLPSNFGGWTWAVTTSQMEFFIKVVIAPKLVAIARKSSTLVVALVLNLSANFTWRRIHHNLKHFYMEYVYQPATGISTKTIPYLSQNCIFENIYLIKISFKNKVLNSSFSIFKNIDLFLSSSTSWTELWPFNC